MHEHEVQCFHFQKPKNSFFFPILIEISFKNCEISLKFPLNHLNNKKGGNLSICHSQALHSLIQAWDCSSAKGNMRWVQTVLRQVSFTLLFIYNNHYSFSLHFKTSFIRRYCKRQKIQRNLNYNALIFLTFEIIY